MTASLLLSVVLPLSAGLLLLSACGGVEEPAPTAGPPSPAVWRPDGDWIEVTVHELHCAGCEGTVKTALGQVEGITEVEADHERDLVRFRVAEGDPRDRVIVAARDALHDVHRDIVGEDRPFEPPAEAASGPDAP